MTSFIRRVCVIALLCLPAGVVLGGESTAPVATPAAKPTPTAESPLLRETRIYVADLTEQRNRLRDENETLRSRQGLLLIYGGLLTLLSGWLILRTLARPTGKAADAEVGISTDVFPANGTTTTHKKNATITIRNSNTQQAEVTDQVQTRRAFARGDTATLTRKPTTGTVTRRETRTATSPTPVPAPAVVAPELDPAAPPAPATRRHTAAGGKPGKAPITVRVEQQSDRLAPVEVAVKPGTAPVRRATADN
jgi:hypothetical protein